MTTDTAAYVIHNRQDIIAEDAATVISLGMMAAIASQPAPETPQETAPKKQLPIPPEPVRKPIKKPIPKKPAIKQYEPVVVTPSQPVQLLQAIPLHTQKAYTYPARPPTPRAMMATGIQKNSDAKIETGTAQQAGAASLRDIHDDRIRQHLKKFKRYPTIAKRRKLQGIVKVEFEINRKGEVLSVILLESAQRKILRRAAITQIQRASPFPPPPAELAWMTRKYIVLVDYELKDM